MKNSKGYLLIIFMLINVFLLVTSCKNVQEAGETPPTIQVIFDTDANNELDDQHALAYLLLNGNIFKLDGVTVNTTSNGGNIDAQYAEAERIVKLCGLYEKVVLLKGADGSFDEIRGHISDSAFDGSEAVNFIIQKAKEPAAGKLILLMVGKLTNAALAFEKDPSIIDRVKIVWLGSNYPDPGEYNLDNDTSALSYILDTNVELEMAVVRYGEPTGTAAVSVTLDEILSRVKGKGPRVPVPVTGRHGQTFDNFGDYSANLFEHIDYHDDIKSRSLFDMAAVAIVKKPSWAESKTIPCPVYENNRWIGMPENSRKITIWENFDRDSIIQDFYHTLENPVPVH